VGSGGEVDDVLAIKVGHKANRVMSEDLICHDLPDRPRPLDCFIWVIRNENRTFVVDTGFGEREGRERGVLPDLSPSEAGSPVGVDAGTVEDVTITHLHHDHARGRKHPRHRAAKARRGSVGRRKAGGARGDV